MIVETPHPYASSPMVSASSQPRPLWRSAWFWIPAIVCSPLLLRLMSGAVIVMQRESDWFYRANAWISWLLPLAIYEIWWRFFDPRRSGLPLRKNPNPPQEVLHASS